ncbi:MAG: endolytic transglycosylase MltG [Candidatus Limnocylindrales bacterium]
MAHPIEEPNQGTLSRRDMSQSGAPNGQGNGTVVGGARHSRVRALLAVLVLAMALLVVVLAFGRPVFRGFAVSLAQANPQTLKVPFVAGLVGEHLGDELSAAAGTDPSPIKFIVADGATATDVAQQLTDQRLIAEPLVFEYLAVTGGQAQQIQAGTYLLNLQMTPPQILDSLSQAPPTDIKVTLGLRTGLRVEQITAYLETKALRKEAPQEFYQLASHPTAELRADYPFLATLPEGRSLEGYLGAGTFAVDPDVTGEQLVRLLLDSWQQQVGDATVAAAQAKGLDFYQVLTLASIVEMETPIDAERPLIAGVYANRLDPKKWSTGILNADPTVIYANDTLQLRALPFDQWRTFGFWYPPKVAMASVNVTSDLQSYQSYQTRGLPDGPIASPTLASIEAALSPNTATGYLYFVAKNDGSHTHAFARTKAEHEANLRKYGYLK